MSAVNPIRPTYPDTAHVLEPGYLQSEAGYQANIFEENQPTLQTLGVMAEIGILDRSRGGCFLDVLNIQATTPVSAISAGAKAGFGGIDDATALAAVFQVTLPPLRSFGLTTVGAMAGVVATRTMQSFQLDLQAALDTHLFADHPGITLPLSLAMSWEVIHRLFVLSDVVERLDLTNFSDSQTSLMAGVGYRFIPELQVDGAFRVGLSQDMPDMGVGFGLTWLAPQLW
jgi:hypothetical protein